MTDAPPAFTVEAALTADEIAASATPVGERPPLPRAEALAGTAAGLLVAGGGAWGAVAAGAVAPETAWLAALALLLAFGAGLAVMLVLLARHLRRQARLMADQPIVRERRRYLIGETGVSVLGETADAHWRWPAFTTAAIRDGLLVLQAGPARSVIIPTRAFADATQAEAALTYCRARIEAMQPSGASLVQSP